MIPLSAEFNERPGTPRQSLTNMYAEPTPQGPREFVLRSRPGLVRAADPQHIQLGTGPVHAVLQDGFNTYVLSGTQVYYNGAAIGSPVASGGFKQFARSLDQIVLVSGYAAYLVTTTDVTQITDPDLPEVSGVVFSNGVFVYPQRDSDVYYFSAVNDATSIDGLGFSSAESASDPIFRVETLNDGIVFLGGETVEYHDPTPDPDTPFRRSQGRTQLKGISAPQSASKADNGLYFIGNDRFSGKHVFRIDGGVAQIVSNDTISAKIEAIAGFGIIDATGFTVAQDGKVWYVFNAPGVGSYALDIRTGKWAEWSSYNETNFRITAGDGIYYGDADGYIFTYAATTYSDDGSILSRVCSAYIKTVQALRCAILRMICETGVSLATGQGSDAVVEMRYSDDEGGDWSPWISASLGLIGDRDHRVMWTQLGSFADPGRLFEFRVTDPVRFVPAGLLLNERLR